MLCNCTAFIYLSSTRCDEQDSCALSATVSPKFADFDSFLYKDIVNLQLKNVIKADLEKSSLCCSFSKSGAF
jgi:hypothetical protein